MDHKKYQDKGYVQRIEQELTAKAARIGALEYLLRTAEQTNKAYSAELGRYRRRGLSVRVWHWLVGTTPKGVK